MSIKFNHSKEHTLGIEVEVQLLDRASLALTHSSTSIIDAMAGYSSAIKHELMLSNLEVNTAVCADIKEAERDLYEKFSLLLAEADRQDTLLSLAGTHPFSSWKDQVITKNERYSRLLTVLQTVAKRFNIFGLHVHVGVGGGKKCIYVMNRLLSYLPHLLALSANSPFWEGENTGLRSYRTKIFETLPTAGLPFYFRNWKEYTTVIESYIATGTIETIREIWWDVRPHPDFGTIEVRICDVPQTITEILAIAALIQSLVATIGNDYDRADSFERPHPWVVRENKWRACRYGLDGDLIEEGGRRTMRTKEAIRNLLDLVSPEAKRLGALAHLSLVESMLEKGDGASRQVAVWQKTGDLKGVTRDLAGNLRSDILANASAGRFAS